MTDDWKKLGDVVKRIVARTEGVMRDRPPVPVEDAALFLKLLTEIYAPAPERGSVPCEPELPHKGSL